MKSLTFSQKAKEYLITAQELETLEKLIKGKDNNLYNKIVGLNALFSDSLIQEPLDSIMARIKSIQVDLVKIEEYMNDGIPVKIFKGKDDEGNAYYDEVEKPIGVLSDKSNGLPERSGALVKELKSSSEDVLDLIHAKRSLLGIDAVTEEDIQTGFASGNMSWTDAQAEIRKNKRNKSS